MSLQAAFSALQAERDKATFVAGLPPIDPTRWLSPAEAAAQLGLQPKTLANWRSKGIGPSFRHAGKAVRYDRYEIECYLVESGSRSAES